MAGTRIDVEGLDEADRKVAQLALFLSDLRPFWPRLVPIFVGWMREQFETEGAWSGSPWAPLSPRYAAWKASRFPGRTILIAYGDLRRGASEPERQAGPRELVLRIAWPDGEGGGGRDPGWHQDGTPRMPARPIVPTMLPLLATREVDREAENYVAGLVRSLGL